MKANFSKSDSSCYPFPHTRIFNIFDPGVLKMCRSEMQALTGEYKETDIFKLYQTVDLANLSGDDGANERFSMLTHLRDELYSTSFRHYVEKLTNCTNLSSTVDCSCNAYCKGHHLLCHDDAMSSRVVSFIIYLTDDDWDENDGGGLEMYPLNCEIPLGSVSQKYRSSQRDFKRTNIGTGYIGQASSDPVMRIAPLFNSCILFPVQPGLSFHAVEEVHSGKKMRFSIQGWFHQFPKQTGSSSAEDVPNRLSFSSWNNLRTYGRIKDHSFFHGNRLLRYELDQEERNWLSSVVNPIYLTEESVRKILKKFKSDSIIELHDFFKESFFSIIESLGKNDSHTKLTSEFFELSAHKSTCASAWITTGPSNFQRYLKYLRCNCGRVIPRVSHHAFLDERITELSCLGSVLGAILNDLFASQEFHRFLKSLTDLSLSFVNGEVRCFRPGSDYTLGRAQTCPRKEILTCLWGFHEGLDEMNKLAWKSGEYGGYECFIEADEFEGEESSTVYSKSKSPLTEDSHIHFDPVSNCLRLLYHDDHIVNFVKYIARSAPGRRWDIVSQYSQ